MKMDDQFDADVAIIGYGPGLHPRWNRNARRAG
jgi:hypothetical protein